MKKQFLFLAACGVLGMAACNGGGEKQPAGPTQAQIDSMANAKAAEAVKQQAEKDSIMNAANMEKANAQRVADSLKVVMEQKDKASAKMNAKHKTSANKLGTPPATTATMTTPPPPPPTVGNNKPSMKGDNQDKKQVGNGKPSMK